VERLLRGFELLRAGTVDHVLISGGPPGPGPGQGSEAALLAGKLRAWGVPAGQIVLEEQSLNTRENATETARIVASRGWSRLLLVTSAVHMERALGCFRKVGLRPDALPVDFRGGESESWLPRAGPLRDSTAALRELAGRVVYRWLGYSTP
jgi:uncharacterized SAM-binding protein YcdF (DUF218 family)